MDAQFWINAWIEGRTGFHQKNYNQELLKYFPSLNPKPNEKVLVPLCGKTKDMLWLADLGLNVVGVELYETAVKEFFTDNGLQLPVQAKEENFHVFQQDKIRIQVGDFFKFNPGYQFDYIYDRAALVALPQEMRKPYSEVLKKCLKTKGKYLLITYEYDQQKMDGPPFSVDFNEVQKLFADAFTIKHLETSSLVKDSSRLASIEALVQKVYLLEKV